MTKSVLTAVALTLAFAAAMAPNKASAQAEVLAEMYGRGVHAFYAGDYKTADRFLSMAIDNGIQDPRAYYFRGLSSLRSDRSEDCQSDWQLGAKLEADGRANPSIGRSLSRFQGRDRLQLESIRQEARLTAMAAAATRSKARYGEIQSAEARVLRQPAVPPAAAAPPTAKAPPVAAAPPATPAAADDPFADDMAAGAATVQSDNALDGAMENPFADDPAAPAGGAPAGGAADPFGGGGGGAADPFGGGGGKAAEADPFGAPDGGGAKGDDPFGSDPFGN